LAEVCHSWFSWFSRFRKLRSRYEKLGRSLTVLNHLAAAIIAFRKVPLKANIIDGLAVLACIRGASSEAGIQNSRAGAKCPPRTNRHVKTHPR
jgi:hypothetical protein